MTAFIIATMIYSFSMSITPGPTNIIMMTAGVNHGFRNTLPFATGAATGFTLLVFVVALGFGSMLSENKQIMEMMGYAGAVMISYMGYKIAFSDGDMDDGAAERPSFIQGAVLQWVNPKSWIACIAGIGAFNLSESTERLGYYMVPYMIVGYLCVLAWGYAGSKISGFLKSDNNLKYFNYVMGGSLVIVAIYLAFMDK
ncbi:MAG: LysE family translocator [Emcibacteraceae bacterium]|nr:LysE family translocator [Emcibacteraceae bacterium]MDG1858453.1 LysE family translocator [Emcibacteraceae bacterium]